MIYFFGDFEIDTRNFHLRENGSVVECEPKVFDLLCYLVKNRGRVVTRDELFENLWKGQVVSETSLSNQVKSARRVIGDDGQKQAKIKTIHGRGYQFQEPVEVLDRVVSNQVDHSSAARDSNDKPSVAVLPFINMSGETDQEFFSDGISEDIITELSRFRSLIVVARNSSFRFRGDTTDIMDVSEKLGARFVLEGSVRKSGNRVRITSKLINGVTGDHVWAERYDGDLSDVFAVQDEITGSIVSTIVGRIDEFDLDLIRSQPTENLSAYESILRAQHLMHHYDEADYLAAQQHVDHAISLDPGYARAYAFKAYLELTIWFRDNDPERLEAALDMARVALSHDDHESRSHLAAGVAYLFRNEHEKAEYHLHRALSLNPNDDLIMIENGRFLLYVDEPLKGAEIVRQAMRQNPYHPNWYWNILGRCLHTAGKYREAISVLERISNPPYWVLAYLAACHAESGNSEKADNLRKATLSVKGDFCLSGFSGSLPYKDKKALEEFLDGFRKAGFAE